MTAEKTVARFMAKVRKDESGCWIWTAGKLADGYGQFWYGGTTVRAHRASYEIHFGHIPDGSGYHGACVCHRCDVRLCVNPEHLFLGTHGDNVRDMYAKGRAVDQRGERHSQAKLTSGQVDDIRRRYATGTVTQRALAREFLVSPRHICGIVRGENWARS